MFKTVKTFIFASAFLSGAALFGQEITGLVGAVNKNADGVYSNKSSAGMIAHLKFSEQLKEGYYSLTLDCKTNFPVLIWAAGKGCAGDYCYTSPVKEMQKRQYYFKVNDPKQTNVRLQLDVPKGNQEKVNFNARDFKLTALENIPGNMFPDFQTALKQTVDGENFIYCFSLSKTAAITKINRDGAPVLSIEGKAEKQGQSIGASAAFPVTNQGKLTLKFTAKSAGGSKQMFVLVRDTFWKKGADRKNFTLTNEWTDYTFEIDCAKKFKEGIALATADCRFGQGVYLFKDFSITYTK